jgi:hypothetical protein
MLIHQPGNHPSRILLTTITLLAPSRKVFRSNSNAPEAPRRSPSTTDDLGGGSVRLAPPAASTLLHDRTAPVAIPVTPNKRQSALTTGKFTANLCTYIDPLNNGAKADGEGIA